jgi:hypothetical protein
MPAKSAGRAPMAKFAGAILQFWTPWTLIVGPAAATLGRARI